MSVAPSVPDPLVFARAVHFAATILAAGTAFFVVLIAAPALRKNENAGAVSALMARIAAIAWLSIATVFVSGAAWFVLTAHSMSGQPFAEMLSQGVFATVLLQTDFGNDWLARSVVALALAATFIPLLSSHRRPPAWLGYAAVILAAALAGSLAWAGHAIGGAGVEGTLHPAADILHLIAAAAWLGALPLLALFLAVAQRDGVPIASAQAAALRFSTLGTICVGTLLATGIVNTWYLVGSIAALVGTDYGQLLLAKVALFAAMVALAAVNRFRLVPRLLEGATTASAALRQLRRNASVETLFGIVIVAIVAVLGTLPPAIHAGHIHPAYGALPADAAFVHIHTGKGMADVTLRPGRTGPAHATVRLWDADFGPLDAQQMSFTLTAPAPGSTPTSHIAIQDADGAWQVDGIDLTQPGNWMVRVDAVLVPTGRLVLSAPIVIEPGP